LQQNNQQEEEEMRSFFVFFKIGIKREKQIGNFFCVATEQSIKRRRRREASFVEAYIPSLQTKLLKFFSFENFFFLHTFCRFLIQFSSFFFPRVHPRTTEGLCERDRERENEGLPFLQAGNQAGSKWQGNLFVLHILQI
jgi:hypothetical protein